MSIYLFELFKVNVAEYYLKCYHIGVTASKELNSLYLNKALDESTKQMIAITNKKIIGELKELLELSTPYNKESHMFNEYMKTVKNALNRDILVKRYICGMSWDAIGASVKTKSRSTIFKRHKECIEDYIKWRKKYADKNGN